MQDVPYGFCHCGCGQKTAAASKTNRRYGHVKGEPLRYLNGHNSRRDVRDRFWEKVERLGPDDCWIWTAARHEFGYGLFGIGGRDGRQHGAHRVSWMLAHDEMPDRWVLHRCDNPPCVNPRHLFLGTPLDNVRDMIAKGREHTGPRPSRKPACGKGHAFTPENTGTDSRTGSRYCRECSRLRSRKKNG
jgi:hypothetical protein